MASDADRKHRRSPTSDDNSEAGKSSKRHKHGHHRHSSRKSERGEDIIPPPIQSVPTSHADDDVEEGEILEDEGLTGSDHQNLGYHKSGEVEHGFSLPVEENEGKSGRNSRTVENGKSDDDLVTNSVLVMGDKLKSRSHIGDENNDDGDFPRNSIANRQDEIFSGVSPEILANGHVGHEPRKEDNRRHRESGSPSKGSGRLKRYNDESIDADDSKPRNERNSLSYEITVDNYKTLVFSLARDRYRDEVSNRSRSRSTDLARERSNSRSIVEEEVLLKRRIHNLERDSPYYADISKTRHDSDDERMVISSLDRQHWNRDLVRGEGREHSTSYSRYTGVEGRHHSRETRDRKSSRDRDMEKDHRKEKERERSQGWRRETERERSRDRELDRDMRREKKRDTSTEREVDRDRKREKERDRSRDRARDTNREERLKDRDVDRDRNRVRDRKSESERESERERRSDRNRDKGRDIERDREKYENHEDGHGDRDRYTHSRHLRYDETEYRHDRTRKSDSVKVHSLEGIIEKSKSDEYEQEDVEEGIMLRMDEQEEEDLNRIKEESRRRRQAILEKYKNQQQQQQQIELHSKDAGKDKDSAEHSSQLGTNVASGVSDGRKDGSDVYDANTSFSVGKTTPLNGITASEKIGARGLGEGSPKSERSDDMFCDDIFGDSPAGVRKLGKANGPQIERSGLHDNWDDAEGYYSYRFGEILDGRYEVIAAHGKGVFSTVVRAKNLKAGNGEPEEVAIKIIRNNDTMYKAGQEELVILKKLVGADPENKRHCVLFLSSFKYRNHLCLVFESLYMNLREVLKKFGRNIGLKLTAVRAYAKQLFIALKHLRNCGVLHCDIKPDNMLVNEAKNVLKLCDFGNAMFAGKNDITPYLVSRFYRAPEIILGLPYDHPIDMWSVGCCLYEIYTGKVLFPGHTNNDMIRLHMELKGLFPKKMLKKGGFIDQHFDQDLNFHATEEDPVTKKTINRLILNIKPKDIGTIVKGSPGEDPKMLANFKDMLEKIFLLDPEKRLTVSQALNHPFITGK